MHWVFVNEVFCMHLLVTLTEADFLEYGRKKIMNWIAHGKHF